MWPGTREIESANWVRRHRVDDGALLRSLSADLDRGEAETIALALALRADLTLIDEREGRRVGLRMGLEVAGVLAVLLRAKERNFLVRVAPEIDRLRLDAGFFVSEALARGVLQLAGEDS